MKMFWLIIFVAIFLILLQVMYTLYYFSKSSKLNKITYVGEKQIGDKKNSEFKLFFDGDSVGAGVGATSFENSVSGRVANYIAHDKYVIFENRSIVGTKMSDLTQKELPGGKWNLVVLIISSNDLFRFTSIERFDTSTAEVLERYSKISDKVIIVGPGRVFDSPAIPIVFRPIYRWRADDYIKVIKQNTTKYKNVIYVNPVNPPVEVEMVKNWASPDNFHPGDEGQRFWFEMIKTAL